MTGKKIAGKLLEHFTFKSSITPSGSSLSKVAVLFDVKSGRTKIEGEQSITAILKAVENELAKLPAPNSSQDFWNTVKKRQKLPPALLLSHRNISGFDKNPTPEEAAFLLDAMNNRNSEGDNCREPVYVDPDLQELEQIAKLDI